MKILSKSGDSLADVYDVEGSIAGIEELTSRDVRLFHEMGRTIFSERFSQQVRRRSTGAVAQDTNIIQIFTDFTPGPTRVYGIAVINAAANTVARLLQLQVSVRDPVQGREIPIWVWDGTIEQQSMIDDGGAMGNHELLGHQANLEAPLPVLLTGSDQLQGVPDIAIRGITTSFGAGTITLAVLISIGFAALGGVSSRGLPIPSW